MTVEQLVQNATRDASRLSLAFGGAAGFVFGVVSSLLIQGAVG